MGIGNGLTEWGECGLLGWGGLLRECVVMARFNPHHKDTVPYVYKAADTWRKKCLENNGSLFSEEKLWTLSAFDELHERFVQNPDDSKKNFFIKLGTQLAGSTSSCKQLMTEIFWVIMLFQSDISPSKKRENIKKIWLLLDDKFPEKHEMLSEKTMKGIGSARPGLNRNRADEVEFFITAFRSFKKIMNVKFLMNLGNLQND